jgi:RNA polymerase sigma-70 factor (ECF subfamily)
MGPQVMKERIRRTGSGAREDRATRGAEAELMAAFLRQEQPAARELYDRLASRIYRLGLVLLRNGTDAEDLVQETFLKIWRNGAAFDQLRGSLDAWVLLNARSLAIDFLRRRRLEALKLSSQTKPSEASDEPGPERLAETNDLYERASEAMGHLPARQRAALELTYLGQRSTREVAELEGVPRGTVKSRLHAGLASLQKTLDGDDDAA